jgi:excisionase family DNA binding protein
MKERNLSPAETARKLGISLEYAYRQIWAGRLPAYKREGKWYVPASEVERRLKERQKRD